MMEVLAGLLLLCNTEVCVWRYTPTSVTVNICDQERRTSKLMGVRSLPGTKTLVIYTSPCHTT